MSRLPIRCVIGAWLVAGAIGCGADNEQTRIGALADPCDGGGCCVDPAVCFVTDEVTLKQLTIDATVSCPFRLGTWVSGGAATGIAPAGFPANQCGLSFSGTAESQASAINALDHHWLQTTDAPIVMDMGSAVNNVFVFPSVDHEPFPEEGIESTVWGSNSPSVVGFPAGWTLGARLGRPDGLPGPGQRG